MPKLTTDYNNQNIYAYTYKHTHNYNKCDNYSLGWQRAAHMLTVCSTVLINRLTAPISRHTYNQSDIDLVIGVLLF